jgi:beta-lactamase regulating signal transducer with metallopeptidase domain
MNLSLPNHDLLGLAWAQFWQVTALIAAVGLAAHLFCRRKPHLAYVLWLLVIVKSLTPPLWSSPTGVFSWASGVRLAAEAPPAGAVGRISNPSYPGRALSAGAVLLGVWASGAAVLAALILARWFCCRRMVRKSLLPTPPAATLSDRPLHWRGYWASAARCGWP